MSRQPNVNGGGSKTNSNGLKFEQTTSLNEALCTVGIHIDNDCLYWHDKHIGYSLPQNKLYSKFLVPQGIYYTQYISKKLKPDDALININTKTVYIIEKKFQSSAGSVDEKLQTCEFKKIEYEKLFNPLNYKVEYIYVLNDWFHDFRYTDVKKYIVDKGCYYFFNEIPLDFLNLEGSFTLFVYTPEDLQDYDEYKKIVKVL